MANEQNLIQNSDRTPSERRANASKAGLASGEARRKRKALKEELLLLLEDGDVQERISLALINEALNGNKAGSVTKAFEVIRDTIGEKPIERVEQFNIDVEYQQSVDFVKSLMEDDND